MYWEEKMNKELRTKDLYLAAFLYLKAHFERVEREGKTCWFVFSNNLNNDDLINEYWSGKELCSAKEYADAIRTIKDRIYSE